MNLRGLRAPHTLQLAFDRSVGGATAAFLAGLARAEIWGGRAVDGRIRVPPQEGDELVRVGDTGAVRAWSWVAAPAPDQPLARPFAYALVQLDGADGALLHVVDAGSEAALAPGLRVRADWRAERTGSVLDIRAFVPADAGPRAAPADPEAHADLEGESGPGAQADPEAAGAPPEPPDGLVVASDRVLRYTFEPGLVPSRFYQALAAGRIEGGRCPACDQVYVPPHERCPACGAVLEPCAVADTGVIESVTVVHLPVPGLEVELPFAWARVRLDGAHVSFPHLVGDVPGGLEEVRVGQRVAAVWAPAGERPPSWEAIRHFRPVEP